MTFSASIPAYREAPLNTDLDSTPALVEHREQTERVLASIRQNAFIDDRERARRITQVIAASNARFLELTEGRPRLTFVPSRHHAAQTTSSNRPARFRQTPLHRNTPPAAV